MGLFRLHLCVCTRTLAISCVLLHPVIIIDECCSLVVMAAFPQLLLSYLLALSVMDLCSCYHVPLMCSPFHSPRVGPLLSVSFWQAVIFE